MNIISKHNQKFNYGLSIFKKGVIVPIVVKPKKLKRALTAENIVLFKSLSFSDSNGLTSTRSNASNFP